MFSSFPYNIICATVICWLICVVCCGFIWDFITVSLQDLIWDILSAGDLVWFQIFHLVPPDINVIPDVLPHAIFGMFSAHSSTSYSCCSLVYIWLVLQGLFWSCPYWSISESICNLHFSLGQWEGGLQNSSSNVVVLSTLRLGFLEHFLKWLQIIVGEKSKIQIFLHNDTADVLVKLNAAWDSDHSREEGW